jgi:hypothetical protein
MRLDHISYVASHDQISDVVNRIGSQIGTAFVDGGIHPKFGTRNFTAPLLNGQYIEVVCPLDHPATDATAFGKAVKYKLAAGGGWLAWVLSTKSILNIEKLLDRKAILGYRTPPGGKLLEWKQIGILETLKSNDIPFFVQWVSKDHPSKTTKPVSEITKIVIREGNHVTDNVIRNFVCHEFKQVEIKRIKNISKNEINGIVEVHFNNKGKSVVID